MKDELVERIVQEVLKKAGTAAVQEEVCEQQPAQFLSLIHISICPLFRLIVFGFWKRSF